ncbi:MAG: TlpA disulfide reductase family protein [Acidobacteriota bacterium]
MTPRLLVGLVLAVVVLLGPMSAASASELGDTTDWTDLDGRTWTGDDLDGRVVVLAFWATWCTPCRAELPDLRRLHERFAGDDVVLLGVALDSLERRRLRSFLLRHGIDWPQIHVPRGTESAIARRFGVGSVPATRILDRHGRVVARDLRGRRLEVVVESLRGTDPGR